MASIFGRGRSKVHKEKSTSQAATISLEASGGDHKEKEKKGSWRIGRPEDKKKPTSQTATSPSKIPFPATTPTSPDDLSLRTSTELYQSPEKQRDQQQKLAEAVREL